MYELQQVSLLQMPVAEAWRALKRIDTLAAVARPLVTYPPMQSLDFPSEWEVGQSLNIRPKLFGILDQGNYWVYVTECSETNRRIVTREHSDTITRWIHTMQLTPATDRSCYLIDTVEIDAPLPVYLFARLFYAHRHRRWKRGVYSQS